MEKSDPLRSRPLKVRRSLRACLYEKCHLVTLHEEGDGMIHRRADQLCPPALLLAQRIESPQSPAVALRRDDSLTTEDMGDATSEVVGSADVPRGDGDHVVTRRVDAEDGRVDVLILQEIAHGADTDPEGGAEN